MQPTGWDEVSHPMRRVGLRQVEALWNHLGERSSGDFSREQACSVDRPLKVAMSWLRRRTPREWGTAGEHSPAALAPTSSRTWPRPRLRASVRWVRMRGGDQPTCFAARDQGALQGRQSFRGRSRHASITRRAPCDTFPRSGPQQRVRRTPVVLCGAACVCCKNINNFKCLMLPVLESPVGDP